MKICITSYGETLDSEVDPKFGRCNNFMIINSETNEIEVINNQNNESSGGAGIQAGQILSKKNVEVLLTGNVGPNAYQVLSAAGIKIYTGISGKIKEALQKFLLNELKETKQATVDSHNGMKGL